MMYGSILCDGFIFRVRTPDFGEFSLNFIQKKGPYPCKKVNTNELNKNFIIENFETFFHK